MGQSLRPERQEIKKIKKAMVYAKRHRNEVIFNKLTNSRKIFGLPIRQETTLDFYSFKMTLDEFLDVINIEAFRQNMKNLGVGKHLMYVEEWAELFLCWHEIENEKL